MALNRQKAEKLYEKSILVLESVQLDNGGCLATPLGERYPYVYPRDHAIILLGLLEANRIERTRKGLEFVFRAMRKDGQIPQRIDMEGKDASYKPLQLDSAGCILYTTAKYLKKTNDKKFYAKHKEKIKKAVEYIISQYVKEKNLLFTPNSIHEFPPTERGLEVWANSSCCGAMIKLSKTKIVDSALRKKCEKYAEKIKKGIVKHLWNSHYQSFIKTIRLNESSSVLLDPDASEYAVANFGVLKDSNPKVIKTVKRIEENLWHKKLGGLCRYPKHEGRNNGGWGPWPHFTLMLARHYINTGNKKEADKHVDWVVKRSWKGLIPEHISLKEDFLEYVTNFTEAGIWRKDRIIMVNNAKKHPMYKKGIAYISLPLAWPHAEFITTWSLYRKKFL